MLSGRGIVVRPVGRAVAGGVCLAHTIRLITLICDVNPLISEFFNNANQGTSAANVWLRK